MDLTFVISTNKKRVKMHIFGFLARLKVSKLKVDEKFQSHVGKKLITSFFRLLNFKSVIGELWFCFSILFLIICSMYGYFCNVMIMILYKTGCEQFEIILSDGYNENRFRNDLKLLFTQIGVHNKRTVVLFSIANDQVSQSKRVKIFCPRIV